MVAPVLDIVIYNEPIEKLFAQGLTAGIVNAITTGVVGTVLLVAYAKTRTKKGSNREKLSGRVGIDPCSTERGLPALRAESPAFSLTGGPEYSLAAFPGE